MNVCWINKSKNHIRCLFSVLNPEFSVIGWILAFDNTFSSSAKPSTGQICAARSRWPRAWSVVAASHYQERTDCEACAAESQLSGQGPAGWARGLESSPAGGSDPVWPWAACGLPCRALVRAASHWGHASCGRNAKAGFFLGGCDSWGDFGSGTPHWLESSLELPGMWDLLSSLPSFPPFHKSPPVSSHTALQPPLPPSTLFPYESHVPHFVIARTSQRPWTWG